MRYRLIRSRELEECASLLHPSDRMASALRRAIPALWRQLLHGGQLHGGVVVESDQNGPILAVGLTTFVEESFVVEYLRSPVPYLSALIYDRMLAGRSPVLPLKTIAAANAVGDLNLVFLHFGVRPLNGGSDLLHTILATAHAGFRWTHFGFRISAFCRKRSAAASCRSSGPEGSC